MDTDTLKRVALKCQQLAKYFADRQSRETTLTPKECQEIVTRSLNAGNLIEQIVRDMTPTETTNPPGSDDGTQRPDPAR